MQTKRMIPGTLKTDWYEQSLLFDDFIKENIHLFWNIVPQKNDSDH